MTLAGDIKNMTIPWFLQDLKTGIKTGTAVFERESEIKKIYFKSGDALFASSNVENDRLGEFLLSINKITKLQYDASVALMKTKNKKQGAVLVELGFISPRELVDAVKLQVKRIILGLFSWRDGRYRFDSGPLPIAELIPLSMSIGNLIIEGVSGLEWQTVRKSLPSLTAVIRPVMDPSALFQGAELTNEQATVFPLVNGNRSLEELCSLSGLGDFNTLRAVYVLLTLRMVEIGELKSEEEKTFFREVIHGAAAEKKGAPGETAPEVRASAATREAVQKAFEEIDGQNHYQILGVARSATGPEIKKAYFKLAMLYHPDRHFDPDMSDMKEKLETLFTNIHDAYDTLSDQARRSTYDRSGIKAAPAAQAQEQRQGRTDPKDAAEQRFEEGLSHYKSGNYWGAEEAFAWAARLDPDNTRYLFHVGLALSHMPRRGHDAEEYFTKAVERAPSKIEYHIELGNFYLKNGLKQKALAAYRNVQKLGYDSEELRRCISEAGSGAEGRETKGDPKPSPYSKK